MLDAAFSPLHKACFLTKLDQRNDYHPIQIWQGDEWNMSFNTPLGHFEYLVMPFGLTNVPAVFQADMRDVLNRFLFVYTNNILIISETLMEHIQHVCFVLLHLLENKLFVKAEK